MSKYSRPQKDYYHELNSKLPSYKIEDINTAEQIYGKNIASIEGKMV
jgi:hypothetical protein